MNIRFFFHQLGKFLGLIRKLSISSIILQSSYCGNILYNSYLYNNSITITKTNHHHYLITSSSGHLISAYFLMHLINEALEKYIYRKSVRHAI